MARHYYTLWTFLSTVLSRPDPLSVASPPSINMPSEGHPPRLIRAQVYLGLAGGAVTSIDNKCHWCSQGGTGLTSTVMQLTTSSPPVPSAISLRLGPLSEDGDVPAHIRVV